MKKYLFWCLMVILVFAGCIKSSVGENNDIDAGIWKVATIENSKGYIQPIARVKNEFGFIFKVYINEKNEKTAGLIIPSKYYRIAENAVIIKFQVDNYPRQRKIFNMEYDGYGANFYLSEKDIHQIKRGYEIKINYLSDIGWSGTIVFDLTNSHKSISYIFNED